MLTPRARRRLGEAKTDDAQITTTKTSAAATTSTTTTAGIFTFTLFCFLHFRLGGNYFDSDANVKHICVKYKHPKCLYVLII